jgi:hypothetical protein
MNGATMDDAGSGSKFMSIDNLLHMRAYIAGHFRDEYGVADIEDVANVPLKRLFFAVMKEVDADVALDGASLHESNQAALRLVKTFLLKQLSRHNSLTTAASLGGPEQPQRLAPPVTSRVERAGAEVDDMFETARSARTPVAAPRPALPPALVPVLETAADDGLFSHRLKALADSRHNMDVTTPPMAPTATPTSKTLKKQQHLLPGLARSTRDDPPATGAVGSTGPATTDVQPLARVAVPAPLAEYAEDADDARAAETGTTPSQDTTTRVAVPTTTVVVIDSVDRNTVFSPLRCDYVFDFNPTQNTAAQVPIVANSEFVPGTDGRVRNTAGFVHEDLEYPPHVSAGGAAWLESFDPSRYPHLTAANVVVGTDTRDRSPGGRMTANLKRITRVQFHKLVLPFTTFKANPVLDTTPAPRDTAVNVPYVLLAVEGLSRDFEGSSDAMRRATCQFVHESERVVHETEDFKTGFITMKPADDGILNARVQPLLQDLNRARFRLLRPGGGLLNELRDDLTVRAVLYDPVTTAVQVTTSAPFDATEFNIGDVARLVGVHFHEVFRLHTDAYVADQTIAEAFDTVRAAARGDAALAETVIAAALREQDTYDDVGREYLSDFVALGEVPTDPRFDAVRQIRVSLAALAAASDAFHQDTREACAALNAFFDREEGHTVVGLAAVNSDIAPSARASERLYDAFLIAPPRTYNPVSRAYEVETSLTSKINTFRAQHNILGTGMQLNADIINVSRQHSLTMDVQSDTYRWGHAVPIAVGNSCA